MNPQLQRETQDLVLSWAGHSREWLRDYLVSGVEDPRLNVQSLLTRHFLIEQLQPGRFRQLQREEVRFALVLRWILSVTEAHGNAADMAELPALLARGSDNWEGLEIPSFIRQTFDTTPTSVDGVALPQYWPIATSPQPAAALDLFLETWRQALTITSPPGPTRLSVIEPACGSANDFRFMHRCGLAPHLDYLGLDLCEANIANAREMFPSVRFEVGNALALPTANQSIAVAFVHDLFEHLSLEAMEAALDELARVTRDAVSLGFFRMHEGPEHQVHRDGSYHLNALSLPRLREALAARGFSTRAIHLQSYLHSEFRGAHYHNPHAYTLIAERPPAVSI